LTLICVICEICGWSVRVCQESLTARGNDVIPAKIDLRLKEGSAAVDAGEVLPNINDGFAGKVPDLGAYELGADLPPYGPRPEK